MKIIQSFICLLLVLSSFNLQAEKENSQSNYIPPESRKLFDPEIIDGELHMQREHWFHNFKVGAIPAFCTNPQAGFLNVYKGEKEKCPLEVEAIMDLCLTKLADKSIPEKIVGVMQANAAGQNMGMCTFVAYQQSLKDV